MKIWLVILLYTFSLYADASLQNLLTTSKSNQNISLNNIISKDSPLRKLLTPAKSDQNISLHGITSDTNKTIFDDKLLDENIISYKQIIEIFKTNPRHFISLEKSYIDKTKLFKERTLLKNRIDINKNRDNDLAVMRDLIALDTLAVEEKKYHFLAEVSQKLLKFEDKMIPSMIDDALLKLQSINLNTYKRKVDEIKDRKFTVAQNLKTNYGALEKVYKFYENLLYYLQQNSKMFIGQKTFFTILKLDEIINFINEKSFFRDLNNKLRFFHIDSGRLVLFLIIILFFVVLKDIGRIFVFFIIKKFLSYYKKGEFSDVMVLHFHNLKRISNYLVAVFGIDLAIKVLYYPKELNAFWDITIYLLYMFVLVSLFFRITETLLEIFVQVKSREKTKMRNELVNLFVNIIKVLIVIIALLLFLRHIGVDITGLVTSLGVGGLAIALASKDTLLNFFASIKVILEDAFHQGDWIETAEFQGLVVELGFTSTKIRTFDNALISVPNEKLASGYIKNWSKRVAGRRIKFHIALPYNSKKENLQNAVNAIREMLKSHPDIVTSQKVDKFRTEKSFHRNTLFSANDKYGMKTTLLVYLDELSPSTIDVLVYAFTSTVNWEEWLEIKQDVIYKIWTILEENSLEFAYPTQMLYHKELDNHTMKEELEKKHDS